MPFSLPRLYPITDARISGLSHAQQVEQLIAGGATLIQLRDKTATPRALYAAAVDAVAVAHANGARLIINDRVDIALAAGADGVHLGQQDLPIESARSLLGPGWIIGFSTHTLEQAAAADLLPVDYVAIGPVFTTSTKENPDPVVMLDTVTEIRRRISKPLAAIGGVTLDRAASVIRAGADCVAVISDLYSTQDIAGRVQAFLDSQKRR